MNCDDRCLTQTCQNIDFISSNGGSGTQSTLIAFRVFRAVISRNGVNRSGFNLGFTHAGGYDDGSCHKLPQMSRLSAPHLDSGGGEVLFTVARQQYNSKQPQGRRSHAGNWRRYERHCCVCARGQMCETVFSIYIHMHTFLFPCMYACMRACVHACLPGCLPACLPACLPDCMHACMHA